jgi:hypothetical protein
MSNSERELAFQVTFRLLRGLLRYRGRQVGEVTGRVVAPIRAYYSPFPVPGEYLFHLPHNELPKEVIIEAMGALDIAALVAEMNPPARWQVIPQELASDLSLEAELELESVEADDEYATNEPNDLEHARRMYDGRWKLLIPFPLHTSFPRSDAQLNFDRSEFELDTQFATFLR